MKLTVLGSGKSDLPLHFRNTAAHLITDKSNKILLDCSDGTRSQLAKIGLTSLDIDAVFFSHFHPDHFSPNCFLQDYLVHYFRNPSKKMKLRIFGPVNLKEKLADSWDAGWGKGKFEELLLKNIDIHVQEILTGDSIKFNDLTVTGYTVKHADMDALAFRVESDGKVISYSGDSTDCPGLDSAAKNSDIFLCEAAIPSIGPDSDMMHLSAKGALKIALKAKAKKLVLTHYSDDKEELVNFFNINQHHLDVDVADDLSEFDL
jgi:ribonuclease BN (tRNA processing enzyme)